MTSGSATSVHTQSLSCSFVVPRRHSTSVQITVQPNKDPVKTGSSLLFPEQPLESFVDFPFCSAKIDSPTDFGYASMYGWLQVVREAPLSSQSTTSNSAEWELDLIPVTTDLNNPLIYFGAEPRLFDAPYRAERIDMDWTSWSFLTYIPDCLMTKVVRPILAIEWGFRIERGNVTIKTLRLLDINEAWDHQRVILAREFAGWTFEPVDQDLVVDDVSERPE
ncbi:unnamed protein product [Aureobasidium uvarum]|uniref:Uncharacterized protein n=1 Tax=Aureobasidium uvarum TaxID=2773716 RepID=A0A9N8KAZ8_9PEZI|nr:unnamed protein product [Aureobasidium uvarum]